jgi:hypothetical protein
MNIKHDFRRPGPPGEVKGELNRIGVRAVIPINILHLTSSVGDVAERREAIEFVSNCRRQVVGDAFVSVA